MAVAGMGPIMRLCSATAIREWERATSRKREGISLRKIGNGIADRL